MKNKRELLHKQLELLAEQSKSATDTELAELSAAMCRIYEKLELPVLPLSFAILLFTCFNSLISILILVEKLFWGHI